MTGKQRQQKVRSAQEADMPLYMRKDDNGYKFVRPIPKALQVPLGKANFIKRLGRDYRQAKIVYAEFAVETERLLAEARGQRATQNSVQAFLARDTGTRLKTITVTSELSGQLAALWLHGLNADLDARRAGLDDNEFESLDTNVTEMLPNINRALASGQVGKFHSVVDQLLLMRGYPRADLHWSTLNPYGCCKLMQTPNSWGCFSAIPIEETLARECEFTGLRAGQVVPNYSAGGRCPPFFFA